MNSDENGCPFEVFITAPGKAGSDLQADAEGLGRMISLQLRSTAPQNRMQMLKLIVEQLQGIGGSRSFGMGPNRVMSLPDAVAGALMNHYFPEDKAQQLNPVQRVRTTMTRLHSELRRRTIRRSHQREQRLPQRGGHVSLVRDDLADPRGGLPQVPRPAATASARDCVGASQLNA